MKQETKICEYCHCEHDGSFGSGRFCSRRCSARFNGSKSNKRGKLTGHRAYNHPSTSIMDEPKKCQYCEKQISGTRQKYMNHVRWCEKNPKRKQYIEKLKYVRDSTRKGVPSWNKGLTKETSPSIKRGAERLKKKYNDGELKGSWIGRHHTEKTKERLSELGRNNPYQRKCKKTLPYIRKDGSVVNLDSSYERYVAKFLDDNNVEWIRPPALKWIDRNGKSHNYFPDFYLPQIDIYLDPKNSYCFKVQYEKIEYIRTHYDNVIFIPGEKLNNDDMEKILAEHTIKTLDDIHQV